MSPFHLKVYIVYNLLKKYTFVYYSLWRLSPCVSVQFLWGIAMLKKDLYWRINKTGKAEQLRSLFPVAVWWLKNSCMGYIVALWHFKNWRVVTTEYKTYLSLTLASPAGVRVTRSLLTWKSFRDVKFSGTFIPRPHIIASSCNAYSIWSLHSNL